MWWIGITGPLGSGKSTVCKFIEEERFPVVQADVIARHVVSQGSHALDQLFHEFGDKIISKSGELDRKALAEIIFVDRNAKKITESIIHPKIQTFVQDWRRKHEAKGVQFGFYEIPLLFEKNLQSGFDKIICVYSSEKVIRKRVKKRDHLLDVQIEARLKSQMDVKTKIEKSDYLIENDGTQDELKKKTLEVLGEIEKAYQAQE